MASTTSDERAVRPGKHIPALDGLRGFAILAVFFHHYGAGGVDSSSTWVRWTATVCGLGWSGVDLFFVLSGFLITGILLDTKSAPAYYRKFYARRALRIFPVYYLFVAIVLMLVPFGTWRPGHLFFLVYLGYPAAVMWPALVHLPIRITHLWSLSVEEQFYLIWPWAIKKLWDPRRILISCGVLFLSALAFRTAFPSWAYATLPSRMDGLALGAALAIVYRGNLRERCQALAFPILAVSSTAVVLICIMRHTTAHADRVVCTVGFSLIVLAYGALLVLSLGPLARVFSARTLRIFGKYSYGMYLYHFPLTSLFEHAKPRFTALPLGSLIYVAACLVANLAIAAVSFHIFEQPILRLKKRFDYTDDVDSAARSAPDLLTNLNLTSEGKVAVVRNDRLAAPQALSRASD
jgi:peptidoglycan/LPS O-acetylase OafA/YrhL